MSMPSNYQIFDYWKDKHLTSTEEVVLSDWGEPSCWCCKKPIEVETEKMLQESDYKSIWNRTSGKLERCHIIPKALGGPDEPSNLFLLCKKCHRVSPDTISKEMFFTWVLSKRKEYAMGINFVEMKRELEVMCKQTGIDMNELALFGKEHGFKPREGSVNMHCLEVQVSSVVSIFIHDYLEHKKKEAVLQ